MTDYYVRPTNGSDANSGTSYANAWKTARHALATAGRIAAGDNLYLCDEADDPETSTLTIPNTYNATAASRFNVVGCDSSGNAYDGSGKYTIAFTNPGASAEGIECQGDYWNFTDVESKLVSGSGGDAWDFTSTAIAPLLTRCTTSGTWGAYGFRLDASGGCSVDCVVDGADSGWFLSSGVSGHTLYGCVAKNTTTAPGGFYLASADDHLVGCIAYNNTSAGYSGSSSGAGTFTNCVAMDNDGDGFEVTAINMKIVGCVAVNNGGYGFDFSSYSTYLGMFSNNCAYNNTSGTDDSGGTWADIGMGGNISTDPDFTSDTDPTPSSTSSVIQAGRPTASVHSFTRSGDIGAISQTPAAGGTSGRQGLHPINSGGV